MIKKKNRIMLRDDIRRKHNMERKYIEYKEENCIYHERK